MRCKESFLWSAYLKEYAATGAHSDTLPSNRQAGCTSEAIDILRDTKYLKKHEMYCRMGAYRRQGDRF